MLVKLFITITFSKTVYQYYVFSASFIIVCLDRSVSSYIEVGIKIWILLNAVLIEEQMQLKLIN